MRSAELGMHVTAEYRNVCFTFTHRDRRLEIYFGNGVHFKKYEDGVQIEIDESDNVFNEWMLCGLVLWVCYWDGYIIL
jgi:hypothetical protein